MSRRGHQATTGMGAGTIRNPASAAVANAAIDVRKHEHQRAFWGKYD